MKSYIIFAILLVVSFGAGYYTHKPLTVTKVQTVVEKQIDHSVITKTIKEPDGTIETDVEHKDIEEVTKDKTSDRIEDNGYLPKYSLGAEYTTDRTYRASAGYRVLGNLWLNGSFDYLEHQWAAGVKVEF